jgi:hypothetical protein
VSPMLVVLSTQRCLSCVTNVVCLVYPMLFVLCTQCLSCDWIHKTHNIGYTRRTPLGTKDKQHWVHKTHNIGYTRQTTLDTQDKQHWIHKTNNIGYTRQTSFSVLCFLFCLSSSCVLCNQCCQFF